METINHPDLGSLTPNDGRMLAWDTGPLLIGEFGFTVPIGFFTDGCPPTLEQLAAASRVSKASTSFKEEVAGYMLEEYNSNIRPYYIKTIADSRYSSTLNETDLPEITKASNIWQIISGLNSVWIDEQANLSLAFITKFDPDHDFAVRFRDGELYEIMMDG